MHSRIAGLIRLQILVAITVFFAAGLCGCGKDQENEEILREAQTEETQSEEIRNNKDSNKDNSNNKNKKEKEQIPDEDTKEPSEQDTEVLYVHVCGQVNSPGVYELPQGSRVFQAIEAAGGITGEAAPGFLNEAAKVSDGQQVYVPAVGEEPQNVNQNAQGSESPANQPDDGKVNINTASAEELMELNGIGKARADSIIKFREEHGNFQSIEELKEVEGIKEGIFTKIKDQIKV